MSLTAQIPPLEHALARLAESQPREVLINPATEEMETVILWSPEAERQRQALERCVHLLQEVSLSA